MTPAAKPDYAAMETLLRARAEDEPGHHNGITPWELCKGCTMENAADAIRDLNALVSQYERQREELRALVNGHKFEDKSGPFHKPIWPREVERIMQFDTPAKGER